MIYETTPRSTEIKAIYQKICLNFLCVEPNKVKELKNLDLSLVLFSKLIQIFQNEFSQRIPEMKNCCSVNDFVTLSRIIHRFKSTTYNLGASRAAEITKLIEVVVVNRSYNQSEIGQLINFLEQECELAHEVLVSYLALPTPQSPIYS